MQLIINVVIQAGGDSLCCTCWMRSVVPLLCSLPRSFYQKAPFVATISLNTSPNWFFFTLIAPHTHFRKSAQQRLRWWWRLLSLLRCFFLKVKFEQIAWIIRHQRCVLYRPQDFRLLTVMWPIYYLWNGATLAVAPLVCMLSQALAGLHEGASFSHLASTKWSK